MRTSKLQLIFLSFVAFSACDDADTPSGKLEITGAEGASTLQGVDSFRVERISETGKKNELFTGAKLPTSVDLGTSGKYKFRATGLDANGNALVRGETLLQDVAPLAGASIPLVLFRTDRLTQAPGRLSIAPGTFPKVGLLGSTALWVWTNLTADYVTTDGYNVAYWQQVSPVTTDADYTKIECLVEPCSLQNLLIVGGFYAVGIADTWAMQIDEYSGSKKEIDVPAGLNDFSDVAGGTVFQGATASAVLVGATRASRPTPYALAFDKNVSPSVLTLSVPRAGAAALFEADVGLVVVGGSATGVGVERVAPGAQAFVALNYPADPVTGATLLRHDATHVLRVGGANPDGTPATTLLIDTTCSQPACEATPLSALNVSITAGRSFFDAESGDSILVGEDPATGTAVVYRYSPAIPSFTLIPVAEAQQRVHAAAIALPHRTVALVGGTLPSAPESSRSILSVVSF